MGFNLEDYEPVASRIARFWAEHPCGAIHTELVFDDGHRCVIKATVYFDSTAAPVSSDYAEEIQTERGVNATSRIENCATSAIGRALAAANFLASDWTKKPSREEMQKVQRQGGDYQPATRTNGSTVITENGDLASDKQRNMIKAVCKSLGKTPPVDLQSFTKRQASAYIDDLKRLEAGEIPPPADNYPPEEPF
jgi:ABC-type branched-subunit amino acid transport system substrate-binding protein